MNPQAALEVAFSIAGSPLKNKANEIILDSYSALVATKELEVDKDHSFPQKPHKCEKSGKHMFSNCYNLLNHN